MIILKFQMWTEKSEEILLEVLNKDLKRCWLQEGPEKNESLPPATKKSCPKKRVRIELPQSPGIEVLALS